MTLAQILGRPRLPKNPVEDVRRRADYERLCGGEHRDGPRGRVVMAVYTTDLDEGRGDVYVAAGLGLALVERGYGVELVPKTDWHLVADADIFVAMLPDFDPSQAPRSSWKVAWVRNETERWARSRHLVGYDQVIASSELASRRLARATPRAVGVLRIGVDTDLFTPPEHEHLRAATAVTTAHFWGTEREAHKALMQLPDSADVAMYGRARGAPASLLRWHREPVSYFALPEVYRRCAIVIDDMNATTVGYGTLNSRFFESAACGSLPLINGLLGVRELGLPDVPRYVGAATLADRLDELRRDPAATAARAAELTTIIRAEHSWTTRAEEFEEVIALGRESQVTPPPAYPLHFFPDYTIANPYQDMVHGALAEIDAYPLGVGKVRGFLRRQIEQPGEPGVLSIHWTVPILQWARGPFRAKMVLDDFTELLDGFIERGGRLIWTVHNVLPHDARHRWAEIELARLLADRADLVQVLSESTLDAVAGVYELDRSKVVVIEHSSYVGEYPDWISREAARRRLGILPGEKALIVLGGIRPYKGIDVLLDVFDELVDRDPTLRLLVAGKPSHHEEVAALSERCQQHPRVISSFDYVPDDQLQVWMNAADLAVLPYRDILNSGAFLLAQSFGLPVAAPDAGTLRSWAGQPHVWLFDPTDPASLSSEITAALEDVVLDPDRLRASALAAAQSRTPDQMAAAFAKAVQPLLAPRDLTDARGRARSSRTRASD